MNIKLIATDLDGTLLTSDKKLTERNKEALKKAHECGIYIVPSTGRPLAGIHDELKQLPFVRYSVIMNGAAVWDLFGNKVIYRCCFTVGQALALWDFAQKYNTMIDAHVDGVGLISPYYMQHHREYVISDAISELVKKTRIVTDDVRAAIEAGTGGVEKINLTFKDADLRNKAFSELKQFDFAVATSSVSNNIEINHVNATKGNALGFLSDYLNIEKENIMTFGDNGNDITMIEGAGYGIAMGNAIPEVKEKAFFVTLDNDNDGVANAIEKYILQN